MDSFLTMTYLLLFFFWFLYFVVHSLMASLWLKNWAHQFLSQTTYRLFFNIFAFVSLLPLIYFTLVIPDQVIFTNSWLYYLGFPLILVSGIVLFKAFSLFDGKVFLGLAPEPQQATLHVNGMYQYVRHPLYFGVIILLMGILCIHPSFKVLGASLLIFLYLIVGSYLEEQKLLLQFGSSYASYQKKVKALIPFIY